MTKDEALSTSLKNLLVATKHLDVCPGTVEAAEAALAQPEPFNPDWASYRQGKEDGQREWVGLTGEEKELIASVSFDVHDAVHRINAKLKEKNT